MPVNNMTFNQLSKVLNSITQQATGQAPMAITNTSDFISVAQTALHSGYDPVLNAISQTLSATIFSSRGYTGKFGGLRVDQQRFGNHVRKLTVVDKDWQDDDRMSLSDGVSVDQQKVNKPEILQTNFYGANVYEKSLTIFKDQLDCAFTTPDEFQRFLAMIMQNARDMIEQAHEATARMTVANFMGGKIKGDATNVIHLVTEYNDVTGLSLTSDTVKKPENFVPFTKWMYGRIHTLSDFMTERTQKFHVNVTGKEVSRHTPLQNQKLYLYTPELNNIESSVLSSVYNEKFLQVMDHERVNFWQSIDSPDGIHVKPSYMDANGAVQTAAMELAQGNILGTLFDEEAAMYTVINQWSAPAPFNARGGYTNIFWHFTDRYLNDFTENGVVLLMD